MTGVCIYCSVRGSIGIEIGISISSVGAGSIGTSSIGVGAGISDSIRLNHGLGDRGPRSFDSKFRNHCTKKLDGALRKSTLYI